jgi:hypothetical protein
MEPVDFSQRSTHKEYLDDLACEGAVITLRYRGLLMLLQSMTVPNICIW